MATASERIQETGHGAVNDRWTTALDRMARVSPWLLVGIYAVLYTVLLFGAAVAAVTLGAVLPGALGVLAFFTLGLGLIAVAPVAARGLFARTLDALDASGEQRAR